MIPFLFVGMIRLLTSIIIVFVLQGIGQSNDPRKKNDAIENKMTIATAVAVRDFFHFMLDYGYIYSFLIFNLLSILILFVGSVHILIAFG